jgi:Asp-tRNA(Asn)/Glu-tRNA(Gln) amidotransferase A subunit family amidase
MFHSEVNIKYDDYTPPMPFREELYHSVMRGKGYRVGICESLPSIPASQANIDAVRKAKAALEARGFEVVDFKISKGLIKEYRDIFSTLVANYSLIPSNRKLYENYEAAINQNKTVDYLITYGPLFRFLFKSILSLTGNGRIREGIEPLKPASQEVLEACMLRQI